MNNDPIQEEIDQAGEASLITPSLLQLDGCRIMTDTDVPEEEFLFRMFGKPCFPRRDLSTVTGLEKCGKTVFTSMLMACCAEKNVLDLERIREEPLKVMWFDTEQSKQSTKGILTQRVKRLVKGEFPEEQFFVFNVRACTYEERLELLITGIMTYEPDIVIIDNVSDLLPSVNDAEKSIEIIEQLMQVAEENECNITVVIHLNRSGEKRSLRGWLGTEILHKTYEAYYCEHIDDTDVFFVEQTFTRKYHCSEKIYYRFNDEGLPESCEKPDYQGRDAGGRYTNNKSEAYQVNLEKADTFNQQYIIRNDGNQRQPWEWNLRRLFDDAMGSVAEMSPDNLKKKVMDISGIKQPKYYDKVFKLASEKRIVKSTMAKSGRIVVIPIPS